MGIVIKRTLVTLVVMEIFSILTPSMSKILVVMVYHCFARCYHWGKLEKGHRGALYVISYN